MVAQIISGLAVAQDVKERVKMAVEELKSQGVMPCLATVLVGDDPASATYVNNKQKTAKELGIATRDHRLAATFGQDELLEMVKLLNSDPEIHGILVQLPLPKHIDEFTIINAISPLKDVDGLTPYSAGMLQARPFEVHAAFVIPDAAQQLAFFPAQRKILQAGIGGQRRQFLHFLLHWLGVRRGFLDQRWNHTIYRRV